MRFLTLFLCVWLQLHLHGRPRSPPWTKLAATATAGNTSLELRESTDWQPGDEIFVTSTEYSMLQAERFTLVAVSEDGRTVELDTPLLYDHWGAGWTSDDGKQWRARTLCGLLK